MRSDLMEGMADFRREVKAVLHTALSETDAPLVVGDLRPGRSVPIPPRRGGIGVDPATKSSASCRVCTADGRVANDMGAVDRELALLEQSNAALFAALAQTRAMPVSRLPPALDARMRSVGVREEARDAARLREAAEIQKRERQQSLEKRQLAERTRDLKHTVLELERQKRELSQKLEEKQQRRERREADARRRRETRRREEEARALRKQVGSSAKEASRLRAKLSDRAEQQSTRARAKEALWRWRAYAARAVASRERKERLAAEQALDSSPSSAAAAAAAAVVAARAAAAAAAAARDGEGGARRVVGGLTRNTPVDGGGRRRRYRDEKGVAAGVAATLLAPSAEYQGMYGGGGGSGGGQSSLSLPVERRQRGADHGDHRVIGDNAALHAVAAAAAAAAGGYSASAALAASASTASDEAATQQQAHEAWDTAQQVDVEQQRQQHREQRTGRVWRRASTTGVGEAAIERAEHDQQQLSSQQVGVERQQQQHREQRTRRVWRRASTTGVGEAAIKRAEEQQQQQQQQQQLSSPLYGRVSLASSPAATALAAAATVPATPVPLGSSPAVPSAERQQSSESRAWTGAAAARAATAAATAASQAEDASRRSWEAREQQLQLSRLAAERSEVEKRVAGAEASAAAAAAVEQVAADRRFVEAEAERYGLRQQRRPQQQRQPQHQRQRQSGERPRQHEHRRAWQRQTPLPGSSSSGGMRAYYNNDRDEEEEAEEEEGEEKVEDDQEERAIQAKARTKALARSLALVLRDGVRAREARWVRSAFGAWREVARAAARAAKLAAVAAGAKSAAGSLGRAEGRAVQWSFRLWVRVSEDSKRKDFTRQVALRQVARRAAQRSREAEAAVFQRWRLAAATAVVERLRKKERAGSIGRGAVVAEAALRRRDAGRALVGFRRWREADAKLLQATVAAAEARDRSAAAATAFAALLHRYRRKRLRRGLQALGTAARVAAERRRKVERARLSAAMSQRAARTLLLTRCWGAWKAFATAGGLARRLEAAGAQAQRMYAERRHLRAEQLAWVCKAAMTASNARRKARAWRRWRQVQGRANTEHALVSRVIVAAAQRWRAGRLRTGLRRWRAGCEAVRSEGALMRSRAARLGSLAAFLGGGSGSLRRTPRMDVARAFGTWMQASEARKVESLQKRQGARIAFGILRSARRNALARAVDAWRSAAARRAQNALRVHSLVLCTVRRQRVFFLGKAWSRIVWAAGEREAARERQLGAARTVHSLLASSARASRHKAWLQWRIAVAGTSAVERLRGAQRRALRRCLRSHLLRDTRAAWEVLRNRVQRSRALVSGAARLNGVLFGSRRRALSRGLGVWRSASVSEAIAAGKRQVVRDKRQAAVRLFGSAAARVKRRRLENGWRALALFAVDGRRAEFVAAARARHTSLLVRGAVERSKRRVLVGAWAAWRELLARRRLRGAVSVATSSLTEQTASLARQVQLLRLGGAVRLMISATERSNRALLQRGWRGLRQASRRRAALVRAVGSFSRARSRRLGFALNHWRLATNDTRAAQLRAGAGRSVLAACLAGARGRAMRPAWESWCELVAREREEEDDFAGREEGLLAFASVISRVGRRRDRDRRLRAFGVWRLRAARVAVTVARQQAARRSEAARAVQVENADLLAAQVDYRSAGARLVLLWLHRRRSRTQLAAWRQWAAVVAENRYAEEREDRRARLAAQLARGLARVLEGRRHRVLRRSLDLWHRHAEAQLAHTVTVGRQARGRETGARRLLAVLERNLLRQQARVWVRLVGSAVAASGRRQRELEVQEQRDRLLAMAESSYSRQLLSRAWFAWKGLSAGQRHKGEVDKIRAASGALVLATVTRCKEEEAQRQVLSLWRRNTDQARQRERTLSRAVSCLLRSETRVQRDGMAHYLGQWRLASAMGGRALANEHRASAEVAFRGQTILSILRRKRAHRLGEGFRRLVHNRTISIYGSKEAQARRDDVLRGLRSLRRMLARRSQRRVMITFARWQCFAAEVGQQGDRALLVSAQRRAGAQMLGSVVARHEVFVLSRAWTVWRSGAASAAIHDGERASADVRVSGARHSAGARLLATAMSSARRRVLWKAWQTWRREAKAAADTELQTMEKHFHLARTLTRVEKRIQLATVRRAWGAWGKNARSVACLPRVVERSRRARLTQGMTRWRVASAERGQAEAEQGRAAAEEAVRARALWVLLKRRAHRQLGEGFNRILRHGAWAIYLSKEEEAHDDRLARGFQLLVRACARRRERRKLAAVSRWRYVASESRRREERDRLQTRGKRAGAKTLASLVSHKEQSRVARAWAIWRSGAASAAVHEGERASADLRVFGARRSAGCRLLVGVLGSARRGALAKAWSLWCKEVRAAADAEVQILEKHFHLARTLTRVERRTQVAKMGRAWRAWSEVVRAEGQAELQALERHFHVAQMVARVVARVRKRRLLRAWGLWARLAARGAAGRRAIAARSRVSASLPSFPPGLLAVGRSSLGTASNVRASRTGAAALIATATQHAAATPGPGGAASSHSSSHTASVAIEQLQLQEQRARRSRAMMYKAGAGAVRGLLRRSEARRMFRSWRIWRRATTAHATREARAILGATRIAELFVEAQENHNARVLHRCWTKWAGWSTAEGGRLEREVEAASWVLAEEEDKRLKAAAAAKVLAAVTDKWEGRALRVRLGSWVDAAQVEKRGVGGGRGDGNRWSTETAQHGLMSPSQGGLTEETKTPRGDVRGEKSFDRMTPSLAAPGSAVSALRRKLRGETSPGGLTEHAKTPHGDVRGEKSFDGMPPSVAAPGSAVSALRRKLRGETSLGGLTKDAEMPHGDVRGEIFDGITPSSAAPGSAVSALRRKLRGETSSGLSAQAAPSVETRKSPGDAIAPPHRLTMSPPIPLAFPGDSKTPTSLLDPQGFNNTKSDAGNDPTPPGSGQAWSDQFNYSSSPCSPYRPPPAGAAGGEPASSVNGSRQLETGMPFAVADRHGDDLGDSLDLTASGESVNALRSYSAGRTISPAPVAGAMMKATASELTVGSPEGSLAAYMSDSSPLLGESYLLSRHGSSDGFDAKGVSVGGDGRALKSLSPEGRRVTTSFTGKSRSGGTNRTTPKSRLSRLSSPSLNSGGSSGGGTGRTGSARFPKSPPYVEGSVEAFSLDRAEEEGVGGGFEERHVQTSLSRQREPENEKEVAGVGLGVSEGSKELRAAEGGGAYQPNSRLEQYQEEEDDEVRLGLEFTALDRERAHAAEDFVDIMTGVLWRWAFKRWARVTRDAAFHKKAAETNLKVIRLKLHQKLRRVVVSAIRRHNFTGHVSDTSSAMRKWKQLVRRCREDERLSLEIAAFSPMTPMRTRLDASGLGASFATSAGRSGGSSGGGDGGLAAAGVRGYGTGVEGGKGEVTPSFYRSSFPATSAADRSSTRRRLWDQPSPKASPIENVADS